MSNFIIGDIHGCFDELQLLLEQVRFDPRSDTLWCTGDLVARGKQSLAVLRYLSSLGQHVRIVLGNHDIHLLAIYAGVSRNREKDNLNELLNAPDCDQLINWLRKQPLLQSDSQLKLLVCHAGLSPDWDLETAQACARELSLVLSSDCYPLFLDAMYGDYPDKWLDSLQGLDKLRYSVNAFTRMRFCYEDGRLELRCKEHPNDAPSNLSPWFNLPCHAVKAGYTVVFGHWAALNGQNSVPSIYALDTGCCWGGKLSLLHYETGQLFQQQKLTDDNQLS